MVNGHGFDKRTVKAKEASWKNWKIMYAKKMKRWIPGSKKKKWAVLDST